MAAAGAVAGLVGANNVLGYKHYFENGYGAGVGFMGIAVALVDSGCQIIARFVQQAHYRAARARDRPLAVLDQGRPDTKTAKLRIHCHDAQPRCRARGDTGQPVA